MPRSAKDIQFIEFKNTISKLNELIMTQTKSMESLQKTIEGLRQELGNKQAEVDYLKAKLFGSSSEKRGSHFPGQMNLFEEMPDERIPEIIEPESIDVVAHRRERKPKATYEEMFDNLPRRQVLLDTLTDEEKKCPFCGTQMVTIGTKTVRTELVFYPAYLECVDYMATTYECPVCKDSLEPQFVKDEGAHHWFPTVMFLPVWRPMSCMGSLSMPYPTTGRRKILKISSGLRLGAAPWPTGQSIVQRTIFCQ